MSRIIGNFRMVHSPESVRRDLEQHAAVFRTEERCREPVRARYGMTKHCGVQAIRQVDGRWMCHRHARKAAQ